MKKIILLILLLLQQLSYGQSTKIYINFVSHNEPKDSLHLLNEFNKTRPLVIEFADLIKSKGASWNLGTCDYFIDGAIQHENAILSPSDVFQTLTGSTYSGHVEVDGRQKNHKGRNIADAIQLLENCGATASKTVSGITWFADNPMQIDWYKYNDTIIGNLFSYKWKAEIIWGAGSPGHVYDCNNYGIWKPDTTTSIQDYYIHNNNRTVWYIGNGCAPKLDTLGDEQEFITNIKKSIDSIQNDFWPKDKIFCYTITLGQDEFGPTLFQKVATICDSVNSFDTAKIEWATLSQKLAHFKNWQNSPTDYIQWECGEVLSGVESKNKSSKFQLFPNPSSGTFNLVFNDLKMHELEVYTVYGSLIIKKLVTGSFLLNLSAQNPGIYFLKVDRENQLKLIKE